MGLRRILVAADASPHSEHALEIGRQLSERSGACLAVVRVREPRSPWASDLDRADDPAESSTRIFRREGVPGVEIARCADQWEADLVVLGRNGRSATSLGATTDMVLRRRHGPTLLVPRSVSHIERILYALDGSERGLHILEEGGRFPAITGAAPSAVCVLPPDSVHSAPVTDSPHPRLTRVQAAMAKRPDLGGQSALTMRWGEPVVEVLRHLSETSTDLLVLGLRTGGPHGDPGSGHVARDLLSEAPVAILTVPI